MPYCDSILTGNNGCPEVSSFEFRVSGPEVSSRRSLSHVGKLQQEMMSMPIWSRVQPTVRRSTTSVLATHRQRVLVLSLEVKSDLNVTYPLCLHRKRWSESDGCNICSKLGFQ